METNLEIACTVVKVFEDLLYQKEIEEIERSFENNTAINYGSEYWDLVNRDLVNRIEFLINMSENEEGEKYVQNKTI